MKYTKEIINAMRTASYLIEPPASEVIGGLLDEIERLQSLNRWIPVSERLPESGENSYLTLSPQGEVFIMCWNEYWFSPFDENGDESVINVTHWRPLPPAPMDEEG